MNVGLVVVAHSSALADGVVEVAVQMAPQVRVVAAGGMADGGVGTDYEKVAAALSDADDGGGVVLLYDLGSAQMSAELAVEALGDPNTAIVADAPLVEGAVAAAVAAQGGSDKATVARAAEQAATISVAAPEAAAEAGAEAVGAGEVAPTEVRDELVLENEIGLHARPAALLARSINDLDADVVVAACDKQAQANSVLGVMGLGARKGDRVELRATGPDAEAAVRRISDLAHRHFNE